MLKKAEMEVKNKKANIYFFVKLPSLITKNKLVEAHEGGYQWLEQMFM